MNDRRAQAYAAEGAVWARLAGLLPGADDADEVQGCWDIGEQEAGLEVLVGRLLEQELAVDDAARAELAVMAGQWGVWDRLGTGIVACRPDPARPARLRVYEDGAEPPVPAWSVLPDPVSRELRLVPWIACAGCGLVLARAHTYEEWEELSYLAQSYVVHAPGGSGAPRVFERAEDGAAWSALAVVRDGCGCG
ncbi:hypothetical protein GCM10010377_07800 [Streptomyces viridiviolaceus]|uniref:Uncharacterized protein n=1 Tax=Streptomyces viridiviolaceus TaxID=68282 RepID=A0ABW2DUJ1_9ACTN|nr:hypothetical protein [Streptomyces viridiviolaceus]GHB20300.1 hypothetical protein GCM10010377_07800 [Streptomyces viridiviolaceus]